MDKPKLGVYFWTDNFYFDTLVSPCWDVFFGYHTCHSSDSKKKIIAMKLFIIDFSGNSDFIENFPNGHQITFENKDGALAYKRIGEQLPDKIFINYKDKPSHGRQTAISIKNRKKPQRYQSIL